MIVDLDPPPGDAGRLVSGSDALGAVSGDLAPQEKKTQTAFQTALTSWQGDGTRRQVFQHAATGIQAELLAVQTAVASVADLMQTYAGALKVTDDKMDELQTFWTGKQLELYSNPDDPEIKAEVEKGGRETQAQADTLRRHMRSMAALIAADIDKVTNLLVPGGAKLTPEQIARTVHEELGVTLKGGTPSAADAWKLLGVASRAAPPGASDHDGSFDLEAYLRKVNDDIGTGTALGGEGWALTSLIRYHVSAADLAKQTNRLYAQIVGESLADLRASRISAAEHVGSILDYVLEEQSLIDEAGKTNKELQAAALRGGDFPPALARTLAVLGLVGDVETLRHLDEIHNPTERKLVGIASVLNALGISEATLSTLLAANAGDEVPGWGEIVATGTGLFLAGDVAYHEGPKLVTTVKDNVVGSIKDWGMSMVRWH